MENNETNEQTKNFTEEELIAVLRSLSVKVDVANAQVLNLGLLVEYLYEQLEAAEINLDTEAFPEWAEKRHEEIKKHAETLSNNDAMKSLKEELDAAAGLDLSE